jgi:hypothetical protein
MQRLLTILLLSCKKATELIDKKMLVKLSFRENVMLHIHNSVCDFCRQYEKQSHLIDEILSEHLQKSDPEQVPQVVNKELKDKIFTRLNKS